MTSKICTKCKENKSLDCFSKRSLSKDGKCSQCKSCMNAKNNSWYKENKDKKSQYSSKHYTANKTKYTDRINKWKSENFERFRDYQSKWEQENKAHRRQYLSNWHKQNSERRSVSEKERRNANPAKFSAKCAKYRAQKLNATPIWFGELDDFVISEAYELAKLREYVSGIPWEVDHIIPLQGKEVCGLHSWSNIQVIPETINRKKSNRIDFNCSFGWLKEIIEFN